MIRGFSLRWVLVGMVVLLATTAAGGQALSPFEDVPPWHWAYQAVRSLAEKGIVQGFPKNQSELAGNAVTQVYEAFSHASHASARGWAELFLTNLPPDWPRPLERSRVTGYGITDREVRLQGARGTVTYLAVVNLKDARALSGRVTVTVVRDDAGRWRVDYSTLAAAQPSIFR